MVTGIIKLVKEANEVNYSTSKFFNYFITPFAMSGNKIDIEVNFKSSNSSPIDESKQQYKSAKEAAKHLGLNFDEELYNS